MDAGRWEARTSWTDTIQGDRRGAGLQGSPQEQEKEPEMVGVGDGEIKKTIQMAGGYSLRFPHFSIVLFKIQVLGVCGFLLETSQGFVCILVGTTDT